MKLSTGLIVKNLIKNEPVKINRIVPLGNMLSIYFTGVNSATSSDRMLTRDEIDNLEIITEEGTFRFNGDPERFKLFSEAERIFSAYQFDPLFAVNCSVIDPLPHQVEEVYKYLLPMPNIRFLLADDTGERKRL